MNNIEKQAERFGMEEDDGFAVMNVDKRDGFKAGAEWAHQELTRWNDPDALPPAYHTVLLGEHCQQRPGKTSQLNPLYVADMMGFPPNWTVSPFLHGAASPSKPTETR